jgi:preprotein translocase subunit SecG
MIGIVIVVLLSLGAGAWLEARFGGKVAAEIATIKAKIEALEGKK